jgi:hypothetical protein
VVSTLSDCGVLEAIDSHSLYSLDVVFMLLVEENVGVSRSVFNKKAFRSQKRAKWRVPRLIRSRLAPQERPRSAVESKIRLVQIFRWLWTQNNNRRSARGVYTEIGSHCYHSFAQMTVRWFIWQYSSVAVLPQLYLRANHDRVHLCTVCNLYSSHPFSTGILSCIQRAPKYIQIASHVSNDRLPLSHSRPELLF